MRGDRWPTAVRGLVGALIVTLLVAAAGVCDRQSLWAANPDATAPRELIGPLTPSIHVPPVRTAPPARTNLVARPEQYDPQVATNKQQLSYRIESLRLAIEDLVATFGDRYPNGPEFLRRCRALSAEVARGAPQAERRFRALREEALLANPLLQFDRLLVLKRRRGQLGLPTNHQCNAALKQNAYDNELAVLAPPRPGGRLQTLFRPGQRRYVGEMDLHYDAQRLLFTMPTGRSWEIFEIGVDGSGLRQVSREVDGVDNFDPCYLPDGRIVFASTASYTGVPCWHGRERACCLFSMDDQGGTVRQLCFDQDLDLHPSVLSNGQVIYSRWDYTGLLHAYVRPLMVMNPDGTGQRAVYGSNSYYPNCLFFPRAVPGQPGKVAAVVAGYHGKNRMGELAVLDLDAGWDGGNGILYRITHRGEPLVPATLDRLTEQATPQFLHPCPLSDKYLLTAMQPDPQQPWGIYLVDVFDNVVPVLTDPAFDFFEPLPVVARPTPRIVPDRTDPNRDDAVIVLHDIYQGPGLRGVPRGTIKQLRVVAYHFGYPGMAGPDKIGRAGPWEVMRILGTVPVYEDGSAKFRLPASTPIALQALDQEGKAVQLMRSWYTAMPGETASCVGCHETPRDTPQVRSDLAALRPVSEIRPWYGPPRGFDFAREVQPVLDRHCVGCHDGAPATDGGPLPDLRAEHLVPGYEGLPLTRLGATRLDPWLKAQHADRFRPCQGMPQPYGDLKTVYTPAYEALIPFVRRVNIEDDVRLLRPGEYHADTSELIQMLQKGHHGVQLDPESWDRLVTWIDLNAPCHGTWGEVGPIPDDADRRRRELAARYGGPTTDPEAIPDLPAREAVTPLVPTAQRDSADDRQQKIAGLLGELAASGAPQVPDAAQTLSIPLDGGLSIDLVQIPAGRFVMGDVDGDGEADQWPPSLVRIEHGFWIATTEVTNAQFRSVFPEHSSGWFTKRQVDRDGPGILLDAPHQPAVRVSWNEALEFCRRLAQRTGRRVTLPSEAQWEYAARAGTVTAFHFGGVESVFVDYANMADRSLACLYEGTAGVAALQPLPAVMEQDDQAIVTADVGSYRASAWGLFDMHGNAAEWTRSAYRAYPYDAADGREAVVESSEKRVVRGGSYFDRPARCRAAHRRAYAAWQAPHDVGFRIVVEIAPEDTR
jgi:formylglycine-generating enzyme required for sulfatase activity